VTAETERARRLAERVRAGSLVVPYPGTWVVPEQLDAGSPLLAEDPGISRLAVDPGTGAVVLTDATGTRPVSSSVAAFEACARAYTDAVREAARLERDGAELDAELERIERRLLRRFAACDAALPGGAEGFWAVAAEEIGLGTAPFPVERRPASPVAHPAADAGRILLALTDADRARLFGPEAWKRLTALAPVTLARAPRAVEAAVELARQAAEARGNPEPRPTVLVTAEAAVLTDGLWAALPALRLVCLLGDRPAPGAGPPPGVRVVALGVDADGADHEAAIERAVDAGRGADGP
jgi:hypothetical protein